MAFLLSSRTVSSMRVDAQVHAHRADRSRGQQERHCALWPPGLQDRGGSPQRLPGRRELREHPDDGAPAGRHAMRTVALATLSFAALMSIPALLPLFRTIPWLAATLFHAVPGVLLAAAALLIARALRTSPTPVKR